mgnify:CR=1 FL=1
MRTVRRYREIILGGLLRIVTVFAGIAMFLALTHYLPIDVPLSDLESSIQLLSQILAMVVGVLLIGTTVSLNSYEGSATINSIQIEIDKAITPLLDRLFSGGRRAHKITRRSFLNSALSRPAIEELQFFNPDAQPDGQWFIYRPNWDGVWYQVFNSPFVNSSVTEERSHQVQAVHEAAICAYTVLKSIADFQQSNCALLTKIHGTNGSRGFLERFAKHVSNNGISLPSKATLAHVKSVIALAIESQHYMREEFVEHSENVAWEPHVLTKFQLGFSEYVVSMIHFVFKLQMLRLANVDQRCPGVTERFESKTKKKLFLKELNEVQEELTAIKKKIVSAHGAASYFHSIKKMSALGVGIALVVLIALLAGWPFLKYTTDASIRILGFATLYATGIAALVESSWFLGRLLWKRRAAS